MVPRCRAPTSAGFFSWSGTHLVPVVPALWDFQNTFSCFCCCSSKGRSTGRALSHLRIRLIRWLLELRLQLCLFALEFFTYPKQVSRNSLARFVQSTPWHNFSAVGVKRRV